MNVKMATYLAGASGQSHFVSIGADFD